MTLFPRRLGTVTLARISNGFGRSITRIKEFDDLFRSGYGYDQPANAYAALGIMAAGSGDTASKYVARRETPLYIPENCTQCMECIAVCPTCNCLSR